MNNNIQCSIESSTTKIELNSAVEGVFLVPELDGLAGLPDIRTTSGVNAGYDGGWTSAQNYDARLISIRGVIANPDVSKVEAKRRAIASLLGQGRKEQLTLRFTTEAGNSYVIYVRTISCEMALQRVLTTQEFLIQLRADDPLIYDDGASSGTEAILQVQKALGGFEINFELPLAIGGGAEDTIVENGSETVYPIINLYGPLHSPTVVNRTTNQQMQILADLQYTISWSGYQTKDIGAYDQLDNELDGAPMYLSQLTGNAEQNALPSAYQAVEYIQSSGTQRIETDYIFTQGDYIEIKVAPMAMGDVAMFGSYEISGGQISGVELGLLNNEIRGNIGGVGTGYIYTTGTSYDIKLQAGQWSCNGANFGIQRDNTAAIKSFIFARNYSSPAAYKPASMRLYSLLIKRGGSTAYNFIPCYRKSDGVIGVYETVNGKFFTNAGTGSFTKGNDTTVAPTPDTPQSIETVTGEDAVKVVGKNLAVSAITTGGNTVQVNLAKMSYQSGNYAVSVIGDVTVSNIIVSIRDHYTNIKADVARIDLVQGQQTSATFTLSESEALALSQSSDPNMTMYKVGSGHTVGTVLDAQLELGSQASDYQSYQGQDYPIDLGSIELAKIGTYQDRIYKDEGKWYIEKQVGKVVFDGSEAGWYYQDSGTLTNRFAIPVSSYGLASGAQGLCNNNEFVTSGVSVDSQRVGIVNSILYYRINTTTLASTTVSDFKTWLASNNTIVYTALATPTTTEITDDTLLSQLDFVASLYGGVNNISIVGTGAQGEIVVKYATVKTINQDVAVIDSQARTITLNGQDIYHLKTEESEFLLLAPGDNKLYLTSEVSDDSGYAEVKFKQGYLSI